MLRNDQTQMSLAGSGDFAFWGAAAVGHAEEEEELRKTSRRRAIKALNDAEKVGNPDSRHLFTDVFDEILPHIKAQEDGLKQHVLRYRDHYPEVAIDAWD